MPQYIVYRHGWNDANQSTAQGLPEKMAVLRIDADSAEEACRLAKPQVTLFGEQYLTAEPAQAVDAREEDLNRRADASIYTS